MKQLKSLLLLGIALAATSSAAMAQPANREEEALAYAQCMRENGYAEFPDPGPDGNLKFLINPETAPRFRKAAEACRALVPADFGRDGITPAEVDALIRMAQCVRENGVAEFPDPSADGGFDLSGTTLGPGDMRLNEAMAACRDKAGGAPIMIGG